MRRWQGSWELRQRQLGKASAAAPSQRRGSAALSRKDGHIKRAGASRRPTAARCSGLARARSEQRGQSWPREKCLRGHLVCRSPHFLLFSDCSPAPPPAYLSARRSFLAHGERGALRLPVGVRRENSSPLPLLLLSSFPSSLAIHGNLSVLSWSTHPASVVLPSRHFDPPHRPSTLPSSQVDSVRRRPPPQPCPPRAIPTS